VEDACAVTDVGPDTLVGNSKDLVSHLESLQLDGSTRSKVVHGQPMQADRVGSGPVALIAGEDLVAVAEQVGNQLKPRVVMQG
jgi:hypothetical protein